MTVTVGGWVCLLAPLVGCVTIALCGQLITRRLAGWISTLSTFVAFGGAVVAFLSAWGKDPGDRSQVSTAYTWLTGGDFHVSVQILVDPLSLVMMLIVSGVGGLDGQIFALAVMAVAAGEVAVGLGLIVAMARRGLALDVDQATALRG